jgi:hypothetical protein
MRTVPGVTVSPVASVGGLNLNLQDGLCGVVLTGEGDGILSLLTPIMVLSLADAITKGVTQDDEPEAYKTVKEFYSEAPLGSPFYLMLAAATTSLVDLMDVTNPGGAKLLVDYAQGALRGLGVMRTPSEDYKPDTDEFVDSDAIEAMPNALIFQEAYFAAHTPLRIMIGFRVADEESDDLYSPYEEGNNAVMPIIGDTISGGLVAMGIFLGKFAATTAEINIGRVKDGTLNISNFFIGSLQITPPEDGSPYNQGINALIAAGYSTVTTYAQVAWYYISDDPLATSADQTNVNNLTDGRIQDKASIVAYQTYIQDLKDNVDVDSGGAALDPVSVKYLEGQILNNIQTNMGTQISGTPTVYIDPAQNLANPLQVQLGITRKGCLRQINVQLALS